MAACSRLPKRPGGFTLIELLVAITIMALLAVLSWRGLDGMARAQSQTSQRADEILTLQAGLAQWKVDLDSLTQTAQVDNLDWDGRVLRLTRRTALAGDGLQVVAWTRRNDAGGQWLRWQSPVLRTASAWSDAWNRASVWAQSPVADDRTREVMVVPLQDWQIFYHRGGAWSNPLSSEGASVALTPAPPPPTVPTGTTATAPVTAAAPAFPGAQSVLPDGIRLVLTFASGQPIAGKLTVDWVRPTLGGDKS